jgi:hypothetical protein
VVAAAALLAAALAVPAGPARAARPMVTDDARIVDPKACQVESWLRSYADGGRELWALPGCNPLGGFELTLGGASLRPDGEPSRGVFQFQVKTLLRELNRNDWGAGLAFGTLNTRPVGTTRDRNHPYVYLPVSVSMADDRVVAHLNVGVARLETAGVTLRPTWGIGAEAVIVPRALLVAETYGVGGERPLAQLGLRLWLVPDRVQVDATVGHQGGPEGVGRWVSVGLRLLSPPFLP